MSQPDRTITWATEVNVVRTVRFKVCLEGTAHKTRWRKYASESQHGAQTFDCATQTVGMPLLQKRSCVKSRFEEEKLIIFLVYK